MTELLSSQKVGSSGKFTCGFMLSLMVFVMSLRVVSHVMLVHFCGVLKSLFTYFTVGNRRSMSMSMY